MFGYLTGSSNKGRDMPSGTLGPGVTSLHISSESPCRKSNSATGHREMGFGNSYVQMCIFTSCAWAFEQLISRAPATGPYFQSRRSWHARVCNEPVSSMLRSSMHCAVLASQNKTCISARLRTSQKEMQLLSARLATREHHYSYIILGGIITRGSQITSDTSPLEGAHISRDIGLQGAISQRGHIVPT